MANNTIFDRISEQTNDLSNLVTKGKTTQTSNHKDARTEKQITQRIQFANIMTMSQILVNQIRGAYQSKPKKLSFHNMFVKTNLNKIKVYLDKEEAAVKACVVAPYVISQGVLPSIEITLQNNLMITSLRVPQGFIITDATTLGEVSAALRINSYIQEGDRISILHLPQSIMGERSIPRATLIFQRFTLNSLSKDLFYNSISASLFRVNNGYIGTDANAEEGGLTYVLSRKEGNKLLVSTQNIVLTPGNTWYKKYSSEEKRKEAVNSYGANGLYVYDPQETDTPQNPEDAYFAVTAVTLNGTLAPKGDGELFVSSGDSLEIKGSKLTDVELKANILVGGPTGNPTTVALSAVGTITATSDTSIKINLTINGEINYLLRADTSVIIYNFI
ncbi:hypothetical protein EZS27_023392 [termite gut metagenome]|uniref:Uncharacterized protein n=1 Tax=termite gut metagenome TaxID=433724 RepID=A0A5J4R228_9ZZZZ